MRDPVMPEPVDLKLPAQIPDQALAIDEVHIKLNLEPTIDPNQGLERH
jgi:hypothetical protein